MKQLAVMVVLAGFCSGVFAQKKIYKSPNDFKNVAGILHLSSGKKLEGMISLDFSKDGSEFTYKPEEGAERSYPVSAVTKFDLNDRIYVKKQIDTTGTGLKNTERFVLIISETFSKLVLYQYDYLPTDITNPPANANAIVPAKMYFVTVPKIDNAQVVSVFSKKLVPELDVKLATALKDLLPLATKVGMKDKGYYYDEKTPVAVVVKIWKTIVEEYNASN